MSRDGQFNQGTYECITELRSQMGQFVCAENDIHGSCKGWGEKELLFWTNLKYMQSTCNWDPEFKYSSMEPEDVALIGTSSVLWCWFLIIKFIPCRPVCLIYWYFWQLHTLSYVIQHRWDTLYGIRTQAFILISEYVPKCRFCLTDFCTWLHSQAQMPFFVSVR